MMHGVHKLKIMTVQALIVARVLENGCGQNRLVGFFVQKCSFGSTVYT